MSNRIDATIPPSAIITALFDNVVYAGAKPKTKEKARTRDEIKPDAKAAFTKVTQPSPMAHELIDRRIIRIAGPITDEVADAVIKQMEFLESIAPEKDIELRIQSPGGSVTAGLAIYDKMKELNCDVKTVCEGRCASMAALLVCVGTPGKRFAMPSSTIMVHGPSGGYEGTSIDFNIQGAEMERLKQVMVDRMSEWCDIPREKILRMMERDHYMSAAMAKENGLIDAIVEPKHKPPTHKSEAEKAFDTLPPFTPGPGKGPNDQPVMMH